MSKVLGLEALSGIKEWVNSKDAALKTELQAQIGSPLVASTVAGMTDHTKVYVYTGSETGYTAGNWYYYNGSAWTSGGVYNSTAFETDPTLTIEGMAADAKATGDEITHVKQDYNEITSDTRNLLRNLVVGAGIDGSGNITESPTLWYYTDYIPADVVTIKANGNLSDYQYNFRICEYDSSKTFLRREISYTNPTTYTPQSGCAYLRFSFYGTVGGSESVIESFKLQAEYGNTATKYINPRTANDEESREQCADLLNLSKNTIDALTMLENNFIIPENLFSPNNPTIQGNGYIYKANSTDVDDRTQASDHSFYSFYIPVKEGTSYAISYAGIRIVYFDSYKNTISVESLSNYGSAVVQTPTGCGYIGISTNGDQSQLMVVEGGSVPSSYKTYKAEFLGVVGEIIKLNSNANNRIFITDAENMIIEGNGFAVDLGVHLTGTPSGGHIVIPYSANATDHIYKVCVAKSESVLADSSSLSVGYNTTLWAIYSDHAKDFKLTPVTSLSALTSNSFYYDGTNITINIDEPAEEYVLGDDTSAGGYGLRLNNCSGSVSNLTVKFARQACCLLNNSTIEFNNCKFMYSALDSAFTELNSSASVLNNCEAFKARYDGFGNRAGETKVSSMVLNNCHGHYCYDDGVSHHNGQFYINGGEYDHNHKGGVSSPTYGSVGNITNVFIHDNGYGVYAVNNSGDKRSTTQIAGCLFKGNNCNVLATKYDLIAYGCTFADTPPQANALTDATLTIY